MWILGQAKVLHGAQCSSPVAFPIEFPWASYQQKKWPALTVHRPSNS